jgi:hypothetical protein
LRIDKLNAAADEARRFLRAVKAVNERLKTDSDFARHINVGSGYKETGAARRASLDLTRALAEARKP